LQQTAALTNIYHLFRIKKASQLWAGPSLRLWLKQQVHHVSLTFSSAVWLCCCRESHLTWCGGHILFLARGQNETGPGRRKKRRQKKVLERKCQSIGIERKRNTRGRKSKSIRQTTAKPLPSPVAREKERERERDEETKSPIFSRPHIRSISSSVCAAPSPDARGHFRTE
jgi:hypothetical protein